MKRPLLIATLFLMAGIVFGRYIEPVTGIWPLFAAGLSASLIIYFIYKTRLAFVFHLMALLGCVSVIFSVADDYPEITDLAEMGELVTVQGVVTDADVTNKGNPRAEIQVDAIIYGGETYNIRMNILAYPEEDVKPEINTRITADGYLGALRFKRNPGGYDEFTYLRARKIQYTFFPDSFDQTEKVFKVTAFLNDISRRLNTVLNRVMPEGEAGVLSAMLLGDRSALGTEIQELYREVGIFHILAVSGLHVTIISMAILRILRRFIPSSKIVGIISVALLALYCLMTGASPGTVRAVVMFAVIMLGLIIGEQPDTMVSCAAAAIILLIYEPLYLWDVGFQYSFAAVFGLAGGSKAFENLLDRLGERAGFIKSLMEKAFIRSNLPPCLAATIATLPVVAYNFHRVPLISVLANLIVIPTVACSVASGFVTCLIGLFNTGLSRLAAYVPRALIRFYDSLCEFLLDMPVSSVITGQPNAVIMIVMVGAMAALGWAWKLNGSDFRRFHGKRFTFAALGILLITFFTSAAIPAPSAAAMLDVGQGDCMVFSKGGRAIAIDGGGTDLESVGGDTGFWTLLPYITYLGIERLDAAFVTHSDADHAIGVLEAILAGRVDRLYLAEEDPEKNKDDDSIYANLINASKEQGTEVEFISAGDRIVFWDSLTIDCLNPPPHTFASGNNTSLVLKARTDGVDFLLAGDIEGQSELNVLSLYKGSLDADVLKLAHHGSSTSNSLEFLENISAEAAIVGTSLNNTYGHPNPAVTGRLERLGIPLYNTAYQGAVILRPKDGEIKITHMAEMADERIEREIKIRKD